MTPRTVSPVYPGVNLKPRLGRAIGLIAGLVSLTVMVGTVTRGEAVGGSSPYGRYPNCVAPAVPLEAHSWWWEDGEPVARHVHMAACAPNARDTTGKAVTVNGNAELVLDVLITAFNNPGQLTWGRVGVVPGSGIKPGCPSSTDCDRFEPPLTCGAKPSAGWDTVEPTSHGRYECKRWVVFNIPASSLKPGLKELRMSPNVVHPDLGTRQFATFNSQIFITGSGPSNYRSTAWPIARSWYTGFGYANVAVNYPDWFTSTRESIPTVRGVLPIKVSHFEGNHTVHSVAYIDADFHHDHNGKVLYDKRGRFTGTVQLDTRTLTNGIHSLYFQTTDDGPGGMNAGALKLFINVQN